MRREKETVWEIFPLAIQGFVEDAGFSVVRDYVGHGIGKKLHEDPQVPNYGLKVEDCY